MEKIGLKNWVKKLGKKIGQKTWAKNCAKKS